MLKQRSSSRIKNEKGMAVLELIPALFVYMLLINFGLGFFGAIHTGILNNIAARNYTFETLRHRANVEYHRVANDEKSKFHTRGYRFSGIVFENANLSNLSWTATARPLAFTSGFGGNDTQNGVDLSTRGPANESNAMAVHNQSVNSLNEAVRNTSVSVSQIWIKSIYGICLNAQCGDN